MELVEPILAVGKQEVHHLVLAVVKAEAVPCGMLTPVSLAEILARVAGKVAQPLVLILHGMAVYDVHDHGNAHRVSLVDERLQFLRRAETAAGSEETAHMIAETAIVRVLLHCHNLYAVVTLMSYARQYIVAELDIAAHLLLVLGHSDVALIDEQGISGRLELGLLPLIRLLGSPCLGAEYLGLGILHHAIDPRRNALSLSTVPMHVQLEEAAVLEGLVLNLNLPVSCLAHTLHGKLGALLPSVEVTHYVDVGSVGSPFAQYPTAVVLAVQSEIEIAVGKL